MSIRLAIKQFFTKEKWALVKIIKDDFYIDKKSYIMYFNLFESNKGARKVELSMTYKRAYTDAIDVAVQMAIYHETVKRWEAGRLDPNIPRYSQVGEEDTMNALKGSV